MARREVYLSSLTAGRCFTVIPTETESETSGPEKAGGKATLQQGRPMMTPEAAWKVTGGGGDEVSAENAAGETQSFAAKTLVVEIPREGYQRLIQRAR